VLARNVEVRLHVNITEPMWSVLETRVSNRYPPPTPLKQLEDGLQDEWYNIPLEAVQNLYESIQEELRQY
jgi:hypothetical protein